MAYPRAEFIGHLATQTNRQRYLELGLAGGDHLNHVAPYVKECVGVCISPINVVLSSNCTTYQMTTNEYFQTAIYQPDLIFIDADHNFESVRTDLLNVKKIMTSNAIVLLHDTDPESLALTDKSRCGDAYRIVELLSNYGFYHVTLPCEDAGLTITTTHRRIYEYT